MKASLIRGFFRLPLFAAVRPKVGIWSKQPLYFWCVIKTENMESITTSTFLNPISRATLTRYKSSKGQISLHPPHIVTSGAYEIYSLEGDLFDDVERYANLQQAEMRIHELLS